MKRLSILGSTGSIGVSALDVIERHPGDFMVVALAAGRNIDLLSQQIKRFHPILVSVISPEYADRLSGLLPDNETEIVWGEYGYALVASLAGVDMVISAMVGAAGLLPTLKAIEAGKDIALANKETLVMAGELVMTRAQEKNVKIIPVDSEHSAVFQCLQGQQGKNLKRIILTASGGPFLRFSKEELHRVSVSDALKHPNWAMGKKITIDSATMMNKGLEIIEAKWLFGVPLEKIDIIIHPQSIIHSMVEFSDCSIIAQLGIPDMRIPISYALCHPERLDEGQWRLDLCKAPSLEFLPPDREKFPCLNLAFEAAEKGGTMTVILNAANEVAVDAFLAGKIGFTEIPILIRETMACSPAEEVSEINAIMDSDLRARETATQIILEKSST